MKTQKERLEEITKFAEQKFIEHGFSEIGSNTLAERAVRWLEKGYDSRSEIEKEIFEKFYK